MAMQFPESLDSNAQRSYAFGDVTKYLHSS
jgi:hypothetical protein